MLRNSEANFVVVAFSSLYKASCRSALRTSNRIKISHNVVQICRFCEFDHCLSALSNRGLLLYR